jgi:predicted nuclease with TOPRIM domain
LQLQTVAKNEEIEAELVVVRDILNAKDAELANARHMLARKEEELRRLLHRWEEREGQLAKARAEVRADRAPGDWLQDAAQMASPLFVL